MSVTWELGILRADEPEPIGTRRYVRVFVDRSSRPPAPIPAPIRAAIERNLVV